MDVASFWINAGMARSVEPECRQATVGSGSADGAQFRITPTAHSRTSEHRVLKAIRVVRGSLVASLKEVHTVVAMAGIAQRHAINRHALMRFT
jgi:hypothetical protein